MLEMAPAEQSRFIVDSFKKRVCNDTVDNLEETVMRPLLSLVCGVVLLSGCHGPGREAGDDPTRNDEGVDQGRPIDDAARQPGDPPAQNTDAQNTDDGNGTLDGASQETTTPER
jgi:hypothetical protein